MRTLSGPTIASIAVAVWLGALVSAMPARAGEEEPLPRIDQATDGLEHRQGLLDLYVDREKGRILLVVPPPRERGVAASFLYIEGLLGGMGSNPVGLDRGETGPTLVVELRRVGPRVLLEVPNLAYRARSGSAAEQRTVRESFASSVIWAAEMIAMDEDGSTLVDLTPFLVRDAHQVVARLAAADQGTFALDQARSAVDPEALLVFPDNVEVEALLTYESDKPGNEVRVTTPVPEAVTLTQHHSFVRLPDDAFTPRRFDPRAGSFGITFADYAAPLGEPTEVRWIARHRLEKTNPSVASSPAKEPIVYYLDPGAPEPIRSALLDGARWWAEAFAAAGFEDAFRVELLPEGAHPLDVRYNVIQWVHRATRGWSYGGAVVDPRTGEILKGHVRLGSLRVRQDIRIFEALLGAEGTGSGDTDDPVQLALARLRQLSAHEVGHTLGFNHNFAASTSNRASVMDYPAPLIGMRADGSLATDGAYSVGTAPWDVLAVRYAYSQFPPGASEDLALDGIVGEGLAAGLVFLTDEDARPAGAAHPLAALWDNGADPVAELDTVLAVRRAALDRFGATNVAPGRPMALLEETLAPLYFYHRYQLVAAAKTIGGLEYRYVLRGDGQPLARPVSGERQRRALRTVLRALEPAALDLSDDLLSVLLPRPAGWSRNREMFAGHSLPAFDPLAAAASAADMVVRAVLQSERLARMVDFHRREAGLPGAEEAIAALIETVFEAPPGELPRHAEIRRAAQWVVADRLVALAAAGDASPAVRTRAESALRDLAGRLAHPSSDAAERAHRDVLRSSLVRFLDRREWDAPRLPESLPPPPGDPIGAAECVWSAWHD